MGSGPQGSGPRIPPIVSNWKRVNANPEDDTWLLSTTGVTGIFVSEVGQHEQRIFGMFLS